jgi:hypothetical protein
MPKEFFNVLRLHRDDLPLSESVRKDLTDDQMERLARKYGEALLENDGKHILSELVEDMKISYTFDELPTDSQEYAIGQHYADSEVQDYCEKHTADPGDPCLADDALSGLGWIFNVKGERLIETCTFDELDFEGQLKVLKDYGDKETAYGWKIREYPQNELKNCFNGWKFDKDGNRVD